MRITPARMVRFGVRREKGAVAVVVVDIVIDVVTLERLEYDRRSCSERKWSILNADDDDLELSLHPIAGWTMLYTPPTPQLPSYHSGQELYEQYISNSLGYFVCFVKLQKRAKEIRENTVA
jgi:hypothetical protein